MKHTHSKDNFVYISSSANHPGSISKSSLTIIVWSSRLSI